MAEFANINKEDCINKSLPKGAKLNASHTLVLQSVINAIKAHGRSSMHKEVCGVLIGNLCWDNEAYLLIDACIEGKYAEHQSGSVTFTSNTWDYIHKELSEKYPNKIIVGWYHTHPGFGIFLSNMDIFIHENFFNIRWQPAYVFDPQAEMEGFFFWNNKDLKEEKVMIIQDEAEVKSERSNSKKRINIGVIDNRINANDEHKYKRSVKIIIIVIIILMISTLWLSIKNYRDLKIISEKYKELNENLETTKESIENTKESIELIEEYIEIINFDLDKINNSLENTNKTMNKMSNHKHGNHQVLINNKFIDYIYKIYGMMLQKWESPKTKQKQ